MSYMCCAGPNQLQIEEFRAKLSDPNVLKTYFDYHYSASLIQDGLSNGTKPAYVLPTPRCALEAFT